MICIRCYNDLNEYSLLKRMWKCNFQHNGTGKWGVSWVIRSQGFHPQNLVPVKWFSFSVVCLPSWGSTADRPSPDAGSMTLDSLTNLFLFIIYHLVSSILIQHKMNLDDKANSIYKQLEIYTMKEKSTKEVVLQSIWGIQLEYV